MERLRTRLYTALAVFGLLMIPLSFLPWVQFETLAFGDGRPTTAISHSGLDTSRWHDREKLGPDDPLREEGWCSCGVDFGDGYLTAGLGTLLIAVAALGWRSGFDKAAAIVAVVASIVAFGLSGFDAIAEWKAIIWTSNGSLEAAEGSIQPALIGLIVVSALAAVFAGVLWGLTWLYDLGDDEEEMLNDEIEAGGKEQWA